MSPYAAIRPGEERNRRFKKKWIYIAVCLNSTLLILILAFFLRTQEEARVFLPDSIVSVPFPGAATLAGGSNLLFNIDLAHNFRFIEADPRVVIRIAVNLRPRDIGVPSPNATAGDSYEQMFPSEADYQTVLKWLTKNGFRNIRTNETRLSVFAQAPIATIERTLKVSFKGLILDGVTNYSVMDTYPSVPESLAPKILGIDGLQPVLDPRPHQMSNPVPTSGWLIRDIRKLYNADATDDLGSNQTVAIIAATVPKLEDLLLYSTLSEGIDINNRFSYTNNAVSASFPNDRESTFDVEVIGGFAPRSNIRLYSAGSYGSEDVLWAIEQFVSESRRDPTLRVLLMSFGEGESSCSTQSIYLRARLFELLANNFVSVITASGNNGARPVTDAIIAKLEPEFAASHTSVTGVGGTSLISGESGSNETAWWGSGGGISSLFSMMPWQRNFLVNTNFAMRSVPDVSALADPGINTVFQGANCVASGTSISAAIWAGTCAIINGARVNRYGFKPVGLLNNWIYTTNGSKCFRDIKTGNNDEYKALDGYDLVTGLGVPDVGLLINECCSRAEP